MPAWRGTAPPGRQAADRGLCGNHGVAARGVSAFPPDVTAQMVANFTAGGAAINQLATAFGARLSVVPLELDRPTADFTEGPALNEEAFLAALSAGAAAVDRSAGRRDRGRNGDR